MEENSKIDPDAQHKGLVISEQTIDIKEVIASKNKRLAAIIPGFLYRYVRRILHEEDINQILWNNKDKYGLEFVNAVIEDYNIDVKVSGLENIPATGKCTLVSNHPLGGLDGIALMYVVGKVRKDISTPANDLLMFVPNLKSLFVPINKHGRNDENISLINQTFANEGVIIYFPAGLCSRKHRKGVVCDLEWKSTFVSKSRRNNRMIIPVHFKGRNSKFFYNLARIRKKLGIKANIEMFYLVNEMFKHQGQEFVITIGKPIESSFFDSSKKPAEWARWTKHRVYELGNEQVVD